MGEDPATEPYLCQSCELFLLTASPEGPEAELGGTLSGNRRAG